jgi:hypothetical protein
MSGVGLVAIGGCLAAIVVSSAGASQTAATQAFITGVSFSGPQSSPTVTVTGTGFGSKPASVPVSGLTNCPGATVGSDYGPNLALYDSTANPVWSAAYSVSTKAPTQGSCIGAKVTTWTSTEIVFRFGNVYDTGPPYIASNGDHFALSVRKVADGGWEYGGVISGLS